MAGPNSIRTGTRLKNLAPFGIAACVPEIAAGSSGAPAFSAIHAAPGRNGSNVPGVRVPSGYMPRTSPRRRTSSPTSIARRSNSPRPTGNPPNS